MQIRFELSMLRDHLFGGIKKADAVGYWKAANRKV
jgi:hypothetical protein